MFGESKTESLVISKRLQVNRQVWRSLYFFILHWKLIKEICFSPKSANLALHTEVWYLEPIEHNLSQNNPIKGCSNPGWDSLNTGVKLAPKIRLYFTYLNGLIFRAKTYLSDLQGITTVSSSPYPEISPDDHCNRRHKKVGSFSCWFQVSISVDIALTFYSCHFFFSHWLLLGVEGSCSELYVNRSVIKGCWLSPVSQLFPV